MLSVSSNAAAAVVAWVAVGGLAVVVVGLVRSRQPASDVETYLRELDTSEAAPDQFEQRLAQPFVARIVRPLGGRALRGIARLTPSNHLDNVHKQLLLAGLSASVRAEEFVTAQIVVVVLFFMGAIGYVFMLHPSSRFGTLALVMAPLIGALLPLSWLSRQVSARQFAVLKDLPDTLDLLAISVEAGMGFEGAISVVCEHFSSPLAEEFSRTLREMELGLPRRDAFQNLKRRTEVPELSNFVLAITQADALGIPIGRVLKTQAAEMRSKRRQWARERAGKLPVKILFPLTVFIFPGILVVLLGPAGSRIVKAFH